MGLFDSVGDFFSGIFSDPTRVAQADTSGVRGAQQSIDAEKLRFMDAWKQSQAMGAPQIAAPGNVNAMGTQNLQQMINPSQSQVMTMPGQQHSLQSLQLMQQAAMGNAPSAAQMQLLQGMQQAQQAQLSNAASMRGGFNPMAMRNAQMQGAALQNQAIQQAGILRAQEMQNAMGLYGQGANALFGNQLQGAGLSQQAAMANQGVNLQATQGDAARALQAQMANQQMGFNVGSTNAGLEMQNRGLQNQFTQGMMNTGMQGEAAKLGGEQAAMNAAQAATNASAQMKGQMFGGLMGAAGMLGAAAIMPAASDEKLKKNAKPGDKEVRDFLDKISAKSYEYKDVKHGEGKQVGVMAQDAEKSKLGKSMVVETDEGKGLDMHSGFSHLLASVAHIHDRLKSLETKRGK